MKHHTTNQTEVKKNQETIKLRTSWHKLGKMMHHTRKQTNCDDKLVSTLVNFGKQTKTEKNWLVIWQTVGLN